jgi:hypothetical protein
VRIVLCASIRKVGTCIGALVVYNIVVRFLAYLGIRFLKW